MTAVRMFKVINHNPEVIRGKYDGTEYVFEPEKPVFVSFDAAKHIFGLGSKDKSQALNQLGWLVPGRDTYADALKKIDMVSFLEGRVVYPTEEEGHGLQPAVIMGRLRSALRAYALLGMTPEDVIRAANRKLLQFEPGAMATVTCVVLAPPFDEIRMCSAGHLPPVLADPDGAPRLLESKPVPPLGVVDELEAHSTRWPVFEGSVLVLCTDGLVERRGESLTEGLERLRGAVHLGAPEQLCGRLMDDLVGSYVPADDIALLVLRIHPAARRREAAPGSPDAAAPIPSVMRSELFACDPSSVPGARRFIGECVELLGLGSLPLVQLLVSELATNAVVHARSCFDVTVEKLAGGGARVEVRDFGGGTPRVLDREPGAVSGHGLRIVTSLARSWGIDERPAGAGKSTWFTVAD